MPDAPARPLRVMPDPRSRPWAGTRLGPPEASIGELWLAGGASVVADGPDHGRTLDALARERGAAFVGSRGLPLGRGGFPLLAKLIDAAAWLSIQVHPDDAAALRLEGPPGIGKTESWLVLEAGPEAAVLLGPAPGVGPEDLRDAVGTADLPQRLLRVPVRAGDRVGVPAGTLHAVGPDLLVYEVQQPSDITYRAWDWGRTDRTIHLDQTRAVMDATAAGTVEGDVRDAPDGVAAASPFYVVHHVAPAAGGVSTRATDDTSPHVITVLEGEVEVIAAGGSMALGRWGTAVLAANAGGYRLEAGATPARVLVASVP